mmetsp:Transcript_24399/g.35878  ORF Transcript_24399/g.35878 Transcript_24399/m.35878 type:complete len:120 (+) Transcript_24399:454-813(+)
MPPKHNARHQTTTHNCQPMRKETFLQLYLLINGVKCHYMYKPLRDFAFAVGVSARSFRCVSAVLPKLEEKESRRKTRSDKGQTVFNSNKRRRQNCGSSMMFKRAKVQGACRRGESIACT